MALTPLYTGQVQPHNSLYTGQVQAHSTLYTGQVQPHDMYFYGREVVPYNMEQALITMYGSNNNSNAQDEGKEVKSCLICGDRATGLHYGIISCEGCKGFFKRSICNRRVYRCTRSKNCVMSRKQRNRCQFCRLLKCLQMGMNRKAIREDGMPGGRNKSIGPVQISDEEIERILSGKDFEDEAAREEEQKAMEAQQRQIMIDNGNNNGHPYPAAIMPPGYLPFMPSPAGSNSNGAGQLDNSNVITSSSASPPIITNGNNTLRGGVPTSGTVPFSAAAARSYMAGSNAAAPQFMPHFPGVPIRDNAYYPGMPPVTSYQLPQINQFVPSQTQSNMSPDTNAELSSSNLVEQLVAAEDTNRLASLDNERVKENTVTKEYLFHTLCRIADEMLHRQIVWIKKLPFFDKLSIKDHTTLLSTTWAEIVLLAALCIHEDQLFGQLADITVKYFPGSEELSRFTDYEMEILEKMTHLYQKFSSLKIDHEDYVIMKVINFLNQDIKGLQQVDKVEDINKRYWYACQRFTELRAMERNAGRLDGSNATTPSTANGAARFRDLMLCLPEIRCVAGKMLNTDVDKLPLLFKAILHTCKLQKINANNATSGAGNPNSNNNDGGVASSPPPSPTSSPANHQHNIQRSTHDEDKMAAAASMLDLTTTGPRVGVPHHHNGATPVRHFMNGSAAATMPSAGVVGAMYIPPVSPRSSSQGTASRDSNSETST